MEHLVPLTVNHSIVGAPTVLLTNDFRLFRLYAPLTASMALTNNIQQELAKHFNLKRCATGVFQFKGVQYFCVQEENNWVSLPTETDHLWNKKHKFSNFLLARILFEHALLSIYFPVFQSPFTTIIQLGKKNSFLLDAVPTLGFLSWEYRPITFGELGLRNPVIMKFLSYQKMELYKVLEEFIALNHERFYLHLKYQLSLYTAQRTSSWAELSQCFTNKHLEQQKSKAIHFIDQL